MKQKIELNNSPYSIKDSNVINTFLNINNCIEEDKTNLSDDEILEMIEEKESGQEENIKNDFDPFL
jgi:hypothetical protein